jgi:hypothetical protein
MESIERRNRSDVLYYGYVRTVISELEIKRDTWKFK